MYLVGCVSFTFLHKVPIGSYFVEAEDKVTALQGGYGVCRVKLWGTLLYHLILQNVGNENIQSLCPIIPTSSPSSWYNFTQEEPFIAPIIALVLHYIELIQFYLENDTLVGEFLLPP